MGVTATVPILPRAAVNQTLVVVARQRGWLLAPSAVALRSRGPEWVAYTPGERVSYRQAYRLCFDSVSTRSAESNDESCM
jgi:hypothetical protein